jgi:hypothetical protein
MAAGKISKNYAPGYKLGKGIDVGTQLTGCLIKHLNHSRIISDKGKSEK